jgi:hypothetical protein
MPLAARADLFRLVTCDVIYSPFGPVAMGYLGLFFPPITLLYLIEWAELYSFERSFIEPSGLL